MRKEGKLMGVLPEELKSQIIDRIQKKKVWKTLSRLNWVWLTRKWRA